VEVIVTLPAYGEHIEEVASHELVSAVRLNTVLPVREPLPEFLRAYARRIGGKPLWIDLKARQLRVVHSAYVPYTFLEVSHRISVRTPVEISLCGGQFTATLREVVDGNRLLIEEISPVPLGSGMSLSIADPSLVIEGYLTARDRAFVAAAREVGLHDYLLSYVESDGDVAELGELDPEARVVAKIESRQGLRFVEAGHGRVRLMAARGDLFHELERPHQILGAQKAIVEADPTAVAASRILTSMKRARVPDCADLSDVGYLLELGYRALLLDDTLCFDRRALLGALAVLEAIARDYR
jgi:pyruvate kinase